MIWEANATGGPGKLCAATLARLIESLTDSPDIPASYEVCAVAFGAPNNVLQEIKMFLISYIHYTSPNALLDALSGRLEQLQTEHQVQSLEQSAVVKRRIQRLCIILEYTTD